MRTAATSRLTLLAPLIVIAGQLTACANVGESPGIQVAEKHYVESRHRNRGQIYAGAGFGLSQLEPDTSERPGFDVSNSRSTSSQLTLGVDVSRQLSTEIHLSNLGSAEFTPNGELDYSVGGISGLLYAGKNRHNHKRLGLSAYGRFGVGTLRNSISGGPSVETLNGAHILLGLGAEYNFPSGFGIRGEAISYEQDANVIQLALIYRFDRKRREYIEPLAEVEPAPVPAPIIAPVAAVTVIPDDDNDGVINELDNCRDTPANITVDVQGCAIFAGVLEGVNFHSSSSELTENSKHILDGVAQTLLRYASAKVNIQAHTDSQGHEEYNLSLSRERANSVKIYLQSRGIDRVRLNTSAFGETQPIAPNSTAEGRRKNRRVELYAAN